MYLITYSSSRWCGAPSHAVVLDAESEDEAVDIASEYMETEMLELYADEDADLEDIEEDSAFTVDSVEYFDSTHEYWKYYKDPTQAEFFPEV